jgi:hypothetical protein
MAGTTTEPPVDSPLTPHPSPLTAWFVLVAHSFQRHWRVRQMGWVALGLLSVCVFAVAAVTARPGGWGLPDRRVRVTAVAVPAAPDAPDRTVRRTLTYREYARQLTPQHRHFEQWYRDPPPGSGLPWVRRPHPAEVPSPLDPTQDALRSLLLSIPHAVHQSEEFLRDWEFMSFTRWVPLWVYLLFVLPLFTLSYASGAFGTEREGRTLVWLLTRPLPRPAVYLAEFVGTLPWCLAFSGGGFVLLCAAGGWPGREALGLYWPAALAGTIAFAALFHLIGAVFRRPVVVGLVYVFFFEALVLSLPGSLKLLSLTFYTRCLMYNGAAAAGYPVDVLDVPGAVSAATAWAVLLTAAAGLTGLGMWLFARREHPDDV